MTSDDDHTLLARIDERVSTLIEAQNDMKVWMNTQNERICQLEACQNKSEGRQTAISVISSFLVAAGTLAVALYTGLVK